MFRRGVGVEGRRHMEGLINGEREREKGLGKIDRSRCQERVSE